MKKMILTLSALAILGASSPAVSAGDREWATAGKILTGVVAGSVLVRAFEPAPVYYHPAPVYVHPAPVYVQAPPPPTVVYSTPVYVQPAPVYVTPAPVYVQPAPVYVAPPPVVRFHFGFGRAYCGPPVYRICR